IPGQSAAGGGPRPPHGRIRPEGRNTARGSESEEAYAHNWFLGVQRTLASGIVIDANYLGSAGRNLHNAYNVNRYAGDLVDGRLDGYNPSFSTINYITSTSQSIYHGATVQLRRTFHQAFMAQDRKSTRLNSSH